MRTVMHPHGVSARSFSIQIPDEWIDSAEDDVLTLMKNHGDGALQLSFAQHLYTPDMLPPHLLDLAEHFASQGADSPLFDQRIWRRIPEGCENMPMSHTGARTPDDVVVGTVGADKGDSFFQYFFILQRSSLIFATYVCDLDKKPGELAEAEMILRTIDIYN